MQTDAEVFYDADLAARHRAEANIKLKFTA